jgi:hypothetical protein
MEGNRCHTRFPTLVAFAVLELGLFVYAVHVIEPGSSLEECCIKVLGPIHAFCHPSRAFLPEARYCLQLSVLDGCDFVGFAKTVV